MFFFAAHLPRICTHKKTVPLEKLQKHRYLRSTGGGTRTHMRLLSPDFESGASANSATPA